jgi:hypothetical protein
LCNISWKICHHKKFTKKCHQWLTSVEVRDCGWLNTFFTSSKLNLSTSSTLFFFLCACVWSLSIVVWSY